MTAGEALNAVERALTDLGLKDKWGDSVIGLEAIGAVVSVCGERWDENEAALYDGRITPEEYANTAARIIRDYGRHRYRNKLENVFADLREVV